MTFIEPSIVIAFELWPAGTLIVVVAPVKDESTFRVAPPVKGLPPDWSTALIVAGLKIWIEVSDVWDGATWMCDDVAGGVAVPGGMSVGSVS